MSLVVDLIAGTGDRFDVAHANLCENLGSVILSERQIVHVKGVFGPDVTTGHTVATIDTRVALHAILVNSVPGEIHRELEEFKCRIRVLIGALLQCLDLQEIEPARMFGYLKSCRGPLVVITQDIHFDHVWPGVTIKDRILGNNCDVGIYQGSAAKTRSLDNADILLLHEIIKAERVEGAQELLQCLK